MILHVRMRRLLGLLASGALPEPERRRVEEHLSHCAACRRELDEVKTLLSLVAADPVRQAEPGITARAMVIRVQAQLAEAGRERRPGLLPRLAFALAAAVVVATTYAALREGPRQPPTEVTISEEFLRRLERNVARAQAVRYLDEAQDLLVTVSASKRPCDRDQRVDIADEARRSRELLARRALLVEAGRAEVASALPVLEDVDNVLREVAALPACARPLELDSIHREIAERRLLMKISLMSRELQG